MSCQYAHLKPVCLYDSNDVITPRQSSEMDLKGCELHK